MSREQRAESDPRLHWIQMTTITLTSAIALSWPVPFCVGARL
jgi:hypothetical protein